MMIAEGQSLVRGQGRCQEDAGSGTLVSHRKPNNLFPKNLVAANLTKHVSCQRVVSPTEGYAGEHLRAGPLLARVPISGG